MRTLSTRQARRFLLLKNGLIGGYRFKGKQGALDYVRQAGCVQYDPVDLCGRSADLTLLSRVKGYRKQDLQSLLYEDRALIDYFDKQLSILPAQDWPCFARERQFWQEHQTRGGEQVEQAAERVLREIEVRGPLSSRDLDLQERADWYWSETRLSRAVLETLYFRGELMVHHKAGNIKFYTKSSDMLPQELLDASDPFPDEAAHLIWRVKRRIGAVGLLGDRASDAFLGLDLRGGKRQAVFAALKQNGALLPVQIEGFKEPLYALAEDEALLDRACRETFAPRTEFLAPLDPMLWDRKLIEALFDFHYRWEIYTPPEKRIYGSYVLPILHGERFVGRIEAVCDRRSKVLRVKNLWWEDGVRRTKAQAQGVEHAIERLRRFNEMDEIDWQCQQN